MSAINCMVVKSADSNFFQLTIVVLVYCYKFHYTKRRLPYQLFMKTTIDMSIIYPDPTSVCRPLRLELNELHAYSIIVLQLHLQSCRVFLCTSWRYMDQKIMAQIIRIFSMSSPGVINEIGITNSLTKVSQSFMSSSGLNIKQKFP